MLTRRSRIVRRGVNGSPGLMPPAGQSAAGGRTRCVLRYAAIIATVTGAAALQSISLLQRIYDTAAVLPGPRMNLG